MRAMALALVATGAAASVRTPGVTYRSVIGDPGMRWKPGSSAEEPSAAWLQSPRADAAAAADATATAAAAAPGPRMQLFFYGLCSKAGYSNFSVLPAKSDTCETLPGQVLGFGAVQTVKATDCCAACLAEPWCLAWTRVGSDSCALKDNTLPQKVGAAGHLPTPGHPVSGFCGQTHWSDGCNTSDSGAWKAKDHNITTLAECEDNCKSCSSCNFASFSPNNDGTGDCSWYSTCALAPSPPGDGYMSAAVRGGGGGGKVAGPVSGLRRYHPSQELPSPRYGNCVVDGKQTVTAADNAAIGEAGVDAEWYAVQKEHKLAELCAVPAAAPAKTPSYFWTVMSQNGNAPSNLGTEAECLPYCYLTPKSGVGPDPPTPFGYPPAVNASSSRCTEAKLPESERRRLFDSLPENQGKVLTGLTDGADAELVGNFNWTFTLDADLGAAEHEFPADADLGIWSWRYGSLL